MEPRSEGADCSEQTKVRVGAKALSLDAALALLGRALGFAQERARAGHDGKPGEHAIRAHPRETDAMEGSALAALVDQLAKEMTLMFGRWQIGSRILVHESPRLEGK
jgi:hypothetical protein